MHSRLVSPGKKQVCLILGYVDPIVNGKYEISKFVREHMDNYRPSNNLGVPFYYIGCKRLRAYET